MEFNDSVIKGFWLVLLLLVLFTVIGTLISILIFNIKIENKKIKKLNVNNFESIDLYKKIITSIIVLFFLYSATYLVFYYKSPYIFDLFNLNSGIINSAIYECKLFYLSLPLYAFEITYLEYCIFLKQIKTTLLYKVVKIISFIILAFILSIIGNLNGFLYSKIIIDFIFLIYIVINLKKILYLCKK